MRRLRRRLRRNPPPVLGEEPDDPPPPPAVFRTGFDPGMEQVLLEMRDLGFRSHDFVPGAANPFDVRAGEITGPMREMTEARRWRGRLTNLSGGQGLNPLLFDAHYSLVPQSAFADLEIAGQTGRRWIAPPIQTQGGLPYYLVAHPRYRANRFPRPLRRILSQRVPWTHNLGYDDAMATNFSGIAIDPEGAMYAYDRGTRRGEIRVTGAQRAVARAAGLSGAARLARMQAARAGRGAAAFVNARNFRSTRAARMLQASRMARAAATMGASRMARMHAGRVGRGAAVAANAMNFSRFHAARRLQASRIAAAAAAEGRRRTAQQTLRRTIAGQAARVGRRYLNDLELARMAAEAAAARAALGPHSSLFALPQVSGHAAVQALLNFAPGFIARPVRRGIRAATMGLGLGRAAAHAVVHPIHTVQEAAALATEVADLIRTITGAHEPH